MGEQGARLIANLQLQDHDHHQARVQVDRTLGARLAPGRSHMHMGLYRLAIRTRPIPHGGCTIQCARGAKERIGAWSASRWLSFVGRVLVHWQSHVRGREGSPFSADVSAIARATILSFEYPIVTSRIAKIARIRARHSVKTRLSSDCTVSCDSC